MYPRICGGVLGGQLRAALVGVYGFVLRAVVLKDAGYILPQRDERDVGDEDDAAYHALRYVFFKVSKAEALRQKFRSEHRKRDEDGDDSEQRRGDGKRRLKRRYLLLFAEAYVGRHRERAHTDAHHLDHRRKAAHDGIFPYPFFEPFRAEPRFEEYLPAGLADGKPPVLRPLHEDAFNNRLPADRYSFRRGFGEGGNYEMKGAAREGHSESSCSMSL